MMQVGAIVHRPSLSAVRL